MKPSRQTIPNHKNVETHSSQSVLYWLENSVKFHFLHLDMHYFIIRHILSFQHRLFIKKFVSVSAIRHFNTRVELQASIHLTNHYDPFSAI